MIKFNVAGTSNSIFLNKDHGYFAVSYYDKNKVSIYDYHNGELIKEINTEYCSSMSNLLTGNDEYFIYQNKAKEIIVSDSKTFEPKHTLIIDNTGAINSVELFDGKKLMVSANHLIGSNISNNVFIFDLTNNIIPQVEKQIISNNKLYVKKSKIFNNSLISLHNKKDSIYLINKNLETGEISDLEISKGNAESINFIDFNGENCLFILIKYDNTYIKGDNNSEYAIFGYDSILNTKSVISFGDEVEVHSGSYMGGGEICIAGYNKNIKKYILSKYSNSNNRTENTILGANVLTEANCMNGEYFAFGADNLIYFVEI